MALMPWLKILSMDYLAKICEYYESIWKKAARNAKDRNRFDAFRKSPNSFNIALLVPYNERSEERLKIRDAFMRFLEENGALEEYNNHLGKLPGAIRVGDFVSDCNFLWSNTAHGRAFWENLSDEWREMEIHAFHTVFRMNYF